MCYDLWRIRSYVIGHGRGTAVSLFGVWDANYSGNLCVATSVEYPFLCSLISPSVTPLDKLINENLIDRFHHLALIVKGG